DAFKAAFDADSLSAFGCVIALNRECDLKTAELIAPNFVELVIAPGFEKSAVELLSRKKNVRLLQTNGVSKNSALFDMRKVRGGLLVQTYDFPIVKKTDLKVVTKKAPSDAELDDLLFAFKVCRHVKSNTIVFAKNNTTVGIGAGQMSRVDSSMIAARKAGGKAKGAVMASDAFFPFRDGIDEAAKAGISAIIQPGGSIRDNEVIAAADENAISMVFSGIRLFKH
ncbi:bifunctional phosphoribosylaminoimidazolecarboxamide formyltransferase/IMP cyclohydrolase, partial [Candidatus Micrarchaeota archaeon]|nr:bifunctional phosphoribosylaminoimidazolecarboxamide formyltransferase/IMP cyclohydrolase [Candidatus Micrarchaeota archaeon]